MPVKEPGPIFTQITSKSFGKRLKLESIFSISGNVLSLCFEVKVESFSPFEVLKAIFAV